MRVLCLGDGPAGLHFAISMKLNDPAHQVTVIERNRAHDTSGWGVVLSDDALGRMQRGVPQPLCTADDVARTRVEDHGVQPGTRALIWSANSPTMVAYWLAITKAGPVVVNTLPLRGRRTGQDRGQGAGQVRTVRHTADAQDERLQGIDPGAGNGRPSPITMANWAGRLWKGRCGSTA